MRKCWWVTFICVIGLVIVGNCVVSGESTGAELEEAVLWSQIIYDDNSVIDEIKRRVSCFNEGNCTACTHMKHCAFCQNGHLYSYAGEEKHTIQQGPMCWSGGFLKMNKTVVSFNIAGKEYGIKMDCRFWKIHSKKCGMSDLSWLLVIISAPVAALILIGVVVRFNRAAKRARYAVAA